MANSSPGTHHPSGRPSGQSRWRPVLMGLAAIAGIALTVTAALVLALQDLSFGTQPLPPTPVVAQPTLGTPPPGPIATASPPALVIEAVNEVEAHPRSQDDWEPAAMGMAVYGGGQVRTGPASSARLALPEGVVRVAAESIFTVRESTTHQERLVTRLFLQQGRLWAHLTTDQPYEFTVETANAVAAVRDTHFSAKVDLDQTTLVSVAEGEVVLTAQGECVTVVAGQQTTVVPGQPPGLPEPMSDEERTLWITEGEMPELASLFTPTLTPTPAPTPTPALTIMPTVTVMVPTVAPPAAPTISPPVTPVCTPPAGWVPYVVQPGDTLASLADRYRISVTHLMQANCLPSQALYTGQLIFVPSVIVPPTPRPPCGPPPASWVPYTVQPGDTLYSLADRTQTAVYTIVQANCLSNYNIYVGQRLWLPFLPPLPPPPTATFTRPIPPIVTATPSPTTGVELPTLTPTIIPTEPPANTPTLPPPTPTPTSAPPTATSTLPVPTLPPPTNTPVIFNPTQTSG